MQFEGAFYHVFSRGNWRERIFWDETDFAKFEEIMIEAMNWSGVRLYAWCLMPNHFHMLAETPDANLSEFMQRLQTRYAKYFNWAHQKVGHLFQGRYGARLCDKEAYFLELIRYIHLNPYRTKGRRLAALGAWKWSSHRFYVGQEESPEGMKRAMEDVLERFGKEPDSARKAYARFVADGLESGTWEDFYQVKGDQFVGGDSFIEDIKARSAHSRREEPRRLKRVKTVQELAEVVHRCYGVESEALRSSSLERKLTEARQAMVYVGRYHYRLPGVQMAAYLGRKPSAISEMLRQVGKQPERLATIHPLLEALECEV
jgi:REP element-mobilizing transposase RayT